ncbi:hypothetical protein BDV95DRAFT_589246 [Massariosphaeria phaeospora]|uniref:Uncharacterized protein n=1 Tax=Massariosphaeria phaeospora TaxID=100035 RepID=A0A7C8IFR6_9PLEO|nr:hypothetical protein BDV95DRAFT_589246 [Massariosphaeria phaeospora]
MQKRSSPGTASREQEGTSIWLWQRAGTTGTTGTTPPCRRPRSPPAAPAAPALDGTTAARPSASLRDRVRARTPAALHCTASDFRYSARVCALLPLVPLATGTRQVPNCRARCSPDATMPPLTTPHPVFTNPWRARPAAPAGSKLYVLRREMYLDRTSPRLAAASAAPWTHGPPFSRARSRGADGLTGAGGMPRLAAVSRRPLFLHLNRRIQAQAQAHDEERAPCGGVRRITGPVDGAARLASAHSLPRFPATLRPLHQPLHNPCRHHLQLHTSPPSAPQRTRWWPAVALWPAPSCLQSPPVFHGARPRRADGKQPGTPQV